MALTAMTMALNRSQHSHENVAGHIMTAKWFHGVDLTLARAFIAERKLALTHVPTFMSGKGRAIVSFSRFDWMVV